MLGDAMFCTIGLGATSVRARGALRGTKYVLMFFFRIRFSLLLLNIGDARLAALSVVIASRYYIARVFVSKMMFFKNETIYCCVLGDSANEPERPSHVI